MRPDKGLVLPTTDVTENKSNILFKNLNYLFNFGAGLTCMMYDIHSHASYWSIPFYKIQRCFVQVQYRGKSKTFLLQNIYCISKYIPEDLDRFSL